MVDRYESILEENASLKKAVQQMKSMIERTANDYETLKQIHEEFKIQNDRNKSECQELQVKVIQLSNDKKELELQFDATIRNLKIAIDLKQREIEEVQAKIIPSFDQDMLRIKIINELEIPHRNIVEQKQQDIDKLQESVYESKREFDILTSKLELLAREHDRDIKAIKDRHQLEISDFQSEILSLNERIDDQRDKDIIRKLRRETEELKQKFSQKDSECEDLRRERDKCREEKNESLIKFSKQIDAERNEKRIYKAESEKLAIRVRYIDEESKKNKIRQDASANDLEISKRERDVFQDEIRKKDDLIHQLQRRISELEEEHVLQEGRSLEKEQKIYTEERDKFLEERNKVISLQREFEQMKLNQSELSEENKTLRSKLAKDVSQLRTENLQLTEERDKLKRIQQALEKDNLDHEKQGKSREEQLTELERELDSVRRKYRESQQRISNLETNVDTLQRYKQTSSVGGGLIPAITINQSRNEDNISSEKLQKELETEKKKVQKLKEKLKLANEKIIDLMQYKVKAQAAARLPQVNNVQIQQQPTAGSLATPGDKFTSGDFSTINNNNATMNGFNYQPGQQQLGYAQQPHLQNQFNYGYLNSNPIQPSQTPYIATLSYEDERILAEINRTADAHRFQYF